MMDILITAYQCALIVLIAPLAAGFVKFFKARLQGRKGASPFLPYYTILTLLKKQLVISKSTSWVFRLAPFVVAGSALSIALILPLVAAGGVFVDYSNFIIVAGLIMVGTIFLVFGGLESASAFGGMGSSREMTIASLVEPTMLLVFGGLALHTGTSNIGSMIGNISIAAHPGITLSIIAFLLIALAENARYPVDNPATHLELTMVHEAMILEYSGPLLALMEYASFLKLTIFSVLLANLIYPIGILNAASNFSSFIAAAIFLLIKVIVIMFLLAFLESIIVKMRFYRAHEFLTIAFFLALAGIILTLLNTIL